MALVWLRGGPSTGKSSISRQVLKAAGPGEAWTLTGDEHLTTRIPRRLIEYRPPGVPPGDGWHVTMADGRMQERPVAGPTALRLLDAMYRGAAAMAAAGVHVLVDDVVWEPAVLEVALAALAGSDPVVVEVRCPLAVARRREEERGDRFPGAVEVYARAPAVIERPDLVMDTAERTAEACAAELVAFVRATDRPSGSAGR